MRILVVEDDVRTRTLLSKGLSESGHQCVQAANGVEALERLTDRSESFDLVLLDVMMPVCDGWHTLERLRSGGNRTPVVMLTARHEVHERVHGLKAGADDYLVKPFAWSELLARIEAVTRRSQRLLHRGDLAIDLDGRFVRCGTVRIEMSPREFGLLVCLAHSPGSVVTREHLLKEVWGITFDPGTNVIDVAVSRLRRRLIHQSRVRIDSVVGQGYALQVPPE